MLREIRILSIAGLEVRSEGDSKSIRGYAAKFDVLSENLGGFREQIKSGAFADVLDNDVRALVNHDPNLILGRNKSGTLDIGQADLDALLRRKGDAGNACHTITWDRSASGNK
jgi:phage head maturation protease